MSEAYLLKNTELCALMAGFGVEHFYGFDMHCRETDSDALIKAIFSLGANGLITGSEGELTADKELKRLVLSCARAKKALRATPASEEKSELFIYLGECCVCMAPSATLADGLRLWETKSECLTNTLASLLMLPPDVEEEFACMGVSDGNTLEGHPFLTLGLLDLEDGGKCTDSLIINETALEYLIVSESTQTTYTKGRLNAALREMIAEVMQ